MKEREIGKLEQLKDYRYDFEDRFFEVDTNQDRLITMSEANIADKLEFFDIFSEAVTD